MQMTSMLQILSGPSLDFSIAISSDFDYLCAYDRYDDMDHSGRSAYDSTAY